MEAKIHHYVPKFLLKNFGTGKKDRLWSFDKQTDRSFQTNAKNVACEQKFYELEFEGQKISLESSLSRIEALAKPVVEKILLNDNVKVLTSSETSTLAAFIAIQFARTRHFRETFARLPSMLREKVERMGHQLEPGTQAYEVTRDPTENELKIQTIKMLIEAPELFGQHLTNKVWFLAKTTPTHPFHISDNPVTLQNHNDLGPYGNLGFAVRGIQIYLPLSSTRTLCMWCTSIAEMFEDAYSTMTSLPNDLVKERLSNPDGIAQIHHAMSRGSTLDYSPENVKNLNSLQVIRSERFIFSPKNNFELARLMISEHPEFQSGQRIEAG